MASEIKIKLPVRYDGTNADSQIFDADGHLVCDVRGWGRLTSSGMDNNAASLAQDEIGEQIAQALNNYKAMSEKVERIRAELYLRLHPTRLSEESVRQAMKRLYDREFGSDTRQEGNA